MKKISLVFAILVLSCSISFAGTLETVGKAARNAGKAKAACVAARLWDENVAEVCSDVVGDAASVVAIASPGVAAVAVAGASASGIMSTMAATGAVVGSGVVVGVPLVAGTGGSGAANLMNKYVFDGNTKADKAARVGTYTGAAVGTAGSIGALAVAGAGPAGLSAIGGVVGGSMVAGAITVLAAPIVVTAVFGGAVYSVYWLFTDDETE